VHKVIVILIQVGQRQLVLVEGCSKRSKLHLAGRNDSNTKVSFSGWQIGFSLYLF
jgi:hypothetical protein